MATITAMTALVYPQGFSTRSSSASLIRSSPSPAIRTQRFVSIRCATEPNSESTSKPVGTTGDGVTPVVPPSPTLTSTPTPAAVPKRQVSTKFGDVFAFSGPAPETINGRLAMVGFVTALGVELSTGASLSTQLENGGVSWFLLTGALFTVASLIPMFKGVTAESKSKAVFSSQAEKLNGRAAMLGLIALALTEFVNGSPLI